MKQNKDWSHAIAAVSKNILAKSAQNNQQGAMLINFASISSWSKIVENGSKSFIPRKNSKRNIATIKTFRYLKLRFTAMKNGKETRNANACVK